MRPSIEDAVSLQRSQDLGAVHIVWLDSRGFVIAHTEYERHTGKRRTGNSPSRLSEYLSETCDLHHYLTALDERPEDVERDGWYRAMDTPTGWAFYPLWGMCACGRITPHLSTEACRG